MSTWYESLRQLRLHAGLTQEQVAQRAGLSPETVSRLERGHTRRPAPSNLVALVAALGADAATARAIFAEVGVDPAAAAADAAAESPFDAALRAIRGYSWPCLLLNERLEIAALNPAALAVGFATLEAAPRVHARGLVSALAAPAVIQRLANWDDFAEALAAAALARGIVVGRGRAPSRYLSVLNEQLQLGNRGAHARLEEMWRHGRADAGRVVLPIVWRADDDTWLRFAAVLSQWSALDGLWALDCHPADAATSAWLAQQQTPGAYDCTRPRVSWSALLQQARRAVGLRQRELPSLLAGRAALASLTSYESGRRRPSRELVLALSELFELDRLTCNRILRGLDARPLSLPAVQPAGTVGRPDAARHGLPATVTAQRWPCLVVDVAQRCRIVAVNGAFATLYAEQLPENLVALVLGMRFRRRALNWEEAAGAIVPGALRQALARDANTLPGWLRNALAAVHREDGSVLPRLRDLFAGVAVAQPVGRAVTPLIWRPDQGEPLSFAYVVSRWSAGGTLWALDLHPADAETWQRLAEAK